MTAIDKKVLNERIESRKIDRIQRVLVICAIVMAITSSFKIYSSTSIQRSRFGWWIDSVILVVIFANILLRHQKQLTNRKGQFIEWVPEAINYKLKNEDSAQTINRSKINSINIHLDEIDINLKSGEKLLLDISDFDKYEDRLRIKANFEKELSN